MKQIGCERTRSQFREEVLLRRHDAHERHRGQGDGEIKHDAPKSLDDRMVPLANPIRRDDEQPLLHFSERLAEKIRQHKRAENDAQNAISRGEAHPRPTEMHESPQNLIHVLALY